ncbi:MAG TPA: hypothetical protein VNK04_12105, partial [Gemmataceae bacterium]|nr:hypothetical protein [Gemmataceae bacterium]
PQPPAVPPAPAAVMGLRASLNHLQRGGLDQALQGLQEAGEEPERLAARGEARWLQYVRQQRAENKPLQADDEPVRQAIEDLKKANTADALFWMGHIQQRTGAVAEALKTYQEAAERFKDDPVQRRRFQTAIDRLKLTAPADAATSMRPGERFKEVQQLALVLVALQPPASAPPGGAEPNEPGFEFWKALLLAQEGKYADALKALEQARALHERQRDLNPRQVRNPLSDPDEAIFLKACDELKAYWLVRQQLQEKGYLDPQRPDAVKALQDLPSRKEAATLKAAADELRKAKEAVAKNAEALQAKVKEVEALQAKVKDAEKAAADARKSAEAAQKTVKDLADKVKAAEDQRQAAEDRLKAVAARLEAAGVKPDDPAKGVDELAAARKAAEAVLNDLARKLKEAKQLSADALAELVQNRPAPKQLETSTGANPLMAEEHYAAGLRAYRARDYATAEKEFLAAIENDSQDARYHYYLGLARLGLNKRDEAFGDFEQGARLEAQGRPGKRAVSAALERVQGLPRLTVNRFRP